MDNLNQAHKDGVVLGLKEVAQVTPRQDIDVLLRYHPDTFNLLLIALLELKGQDVPWTIPDDFKVTASDKLSYYQIAGIHGLPLVQWDGEVRKGKPLYCTHSQPHFGLWHRPYLAMLEQTLYRQMVNIVERFAASKRLSDSEKKAYSDAVNEFRLPYWDYYRPRNYEFDMSGPQSDQTKPYDYSMPQIFTLPEVMVKTLPDNEIKPMANPFYNYKFHTDEFKPEQWKASGLDLSLPNIMLQTLRYGNENDPVKAMNAALNHDREDRMRMSLCMIENGLYENFANFSTIGVSIKDTEFPFKNPTKTYGSIENLHNGYHLSCGGTKRVANKGVPMGHMSDVPVAAFDPVFWIHHCQIDRLFAIWQSVNSTHWFDELSHTAPEGKIPPSELHTASLIPFRKSPLTKNPDERYWTPDTAKDTKTFGYTYPDIRDGASVDEIRDTFAQNYGWSRQLTPFQQFGQPPAEMMPLDLSGAQVYSYTKDVPSAKLFQPLRTPKLVQRRMAKMSPAVAQVPIKLAESQVPNGSAASRAPNGSAASRVPNGSAASQAPNGSVGSQGPNGSADSQVSHEWYVDDIVERMAMDGTFTIFYILGDVSNDDGVPWTQLPGFIGATHVFTAASAVCGNCNSQAQNKQLVTGTTPFTSRLIENVESGRLNSMRPADVNPFLVKNLKWRAQTIDGRQINPRDLARNHNFKISISCKTAPLPGHAGEVSYATYADVTDEIIANSS